MLLCFLLGLVCLSTISATGSDEEADAYFPASEWSDTFDWKLLKAFSTPNSRNVLISPIGLKVVLALLYEGSGGLTEKEFQNVLQFPIEKSKMREQFKNISKALQPSERSQYILNLGTRIFLDSRVTPQQNFAAKALDGYRTDIEPTNYSQPIEASQTINSWIDKLTNGKVSRLVAPGDLEDAIMIIANAIYFKGTWRHQFPKNNTALGGFYVSPNEILTVPYMTTTDAFYYFESNELDAKILRLPYKGQNYALFVVLPNSKAGLSDLMKKVNLHVLKKQLYMLDKVPVEVRLPKFKFNFQARYMKILQDFGLTQMFQNTASFPGIARGNIPHLLRMLVVSDIIQKTGIELDEEGSVVYAATHVQVGNKFAEVDYVFNATHPFMFFLEEQTSGTILFVGKVENPLETVGVPLPPRFGSNQGLESTLSASPNLQPANPERDAVIRRFNYFDLELLKEFSESPGNVFISPASIKTTLALILEGAKGQSAREIGNALRIDDIEQKEIREILSRLLFDLKDSTGNTVLESASSIFVSNKYNVVPEFEKKVITYYNGLIKHLDFSNPNLAAKIINSWVSNATHGLIDQIVGNQHLSPDTALLLTNALYFKGKWKTEFNPNGTKEKCFFSPTRNCVSTPLMQVTSTFNYNFNIDLNAHAIELPYQDDKYAMLILFPTNGNNVRTLARDMQHAQLHMVIDALKPTDLILEIPKFEIDYETDLVSFLRPLKIQEIFQANANLTGMVAQEKVKISNIVHKTKVQVNEQGTRAAAVTTAVVIPLMGSTAQRIVVDQPFIFFIYHRESRNIIFEGLFVEPGAPKTAPNTNRYYSQVPQRSGVNYQRRDFNYQRSNNRYQ
ncbi:serpin peptidase inhibitor 5 isoform X1 [Tribolium castaneum]|uniref:93 kDa serpin n=1 Tax=Tribolium castaneum TaxID=7070 RepID=G3XGC5_TRICA|nr:93 kDa serpin [Tribolium castaneum]